ncbi:MAG: hypothetical protein LPK19_17460, partial [Hymenobacteraceae bacterium]|nr:hypothetical protein [Hymenobacteraceae bacterium]MDX5398044.1 hypothetical protein [Hymenobacteraceae bacterium]MDX5514115.1 hypothetical protein [Hymenobacteraceae bacterium]
MKNELWLHRLQPVKLNLLKLLLSKNFTFAMALKPWQVLFQNTTYFSANFLKNRLKTVFHTYLC